MKSIRRSYGRIVQNSFFLKVKNSVLLPSLKSFFSSPRVHGFLSGILSMGVAMGLCLFLVPSSSPLLSPSLSPPPWSEVQEMIQKEAFDPPSSERLYEGALSGMLGTVDAYSAYLSPESYQFFRDITEGQFGGIGLEVKSESKGLRVVSVLPGAPAHQGRIKEEDLIVDLIEETPSFPHKTKNLLYRLHGPSGSRVTLRIQRKEEAVFSVSLTRGLVEINPVRSKKYGTIGYLSILSFHEKTTIQAAEALSFLQKSSITGIVLDLRNNPGGTLEQAVGVTSLFVDQGKIVETRGRRFPKRHFYEAQGTALCKTLPMIVLVNHASASASEIVAGALQDHKRAILLGLPTLGKGSVQELFPLKQGAAVKLTTSRFYTPLGRDIQDEGIQPDLYVEGIVPSPYGEDTPLSEDVQLSQALDILKGITLLQSSQSP